MVCGTDKLPSPAKPYISLQVSPTLSDPNHLILLPLNLVPAGPVLVQAGKVLFLLVFWGFSLCAPKEVAH